MEHRASHLKISGEGKPEVAQLYNNRYRCEYRCVGVSSTDWYYENLPRIFAEYGSLANAEMTLNGKGGSTEIPKSIYPDMRLMRNALEYTPSGSLVVMFHYETLTGSFVQEVEDKVDNDKGGLRRLTRTVIALRGTTYGNVVGTSSIVHSDEGYTPATLYLSSAIEEDKPSHWAGYTRIVETWIEPGLLSTSFSTDSDGLTKHSQTWLKTVGTSPALPDGVTTGRTIGEYEGLQTITIEKQGFPTNGTFTYETTVPFSIPGIVTTNEVNLGANNVNLMLKVTPPIPSVPCDAVVTVTYSTVSTVDTSAIYRPLEWASQQTTGFGFNYRRLSSYSTFNNHIRVGDGGSKTNQAGLPDGTIECVQGVPVYGGTTAYITLEGPTLDPAGTNITLSISNDPIFKDESGVQFYKKTVVTIDVPARP